MGTEDDALSGRLAAYLIDFGLLSAVAVVLWFVSWIVTTVLVVGAAGSGSDAAFAAGTFAGLIMNLFLWPVIGVIVLGYFTYLDGSAGGTLGKRVMDVVVAGQDGSPASMRDAGIRTVVLMVPFPLMALLGIVLGAFGFVVDLFLMFGWLAVEAAVLFVSDDHRRLGDRAAGTVVLKRASTAGEGAGTADAGRSTHHTHRHHHDELGEFGEDRGEAAEASHDDGYGTGGDDSGGGFGGGGGGGGGGGE